MRSRVEKIYNYLKVHRISSLQFILALFLILAFFSCAVVITFDSAHYLTYMPIFEGLEPFSQWQIVRGPVFPLIIFMSNILFGKTSQGILICLFIFYAIFVVLCNLLCKLLCQNISLKYQKPIRYILFGFLILNPIIFGYFHVLLTEFIAITIVMLNIFVSYVWIQSDQDSIKKKILFYIYFAISLAFCYQLKQPYFTIALIPSLIAAILSIVKNHKKINIIYRLSVIVCSIIFMFLSIFTWNGIAKANQVNLANGDATNMASSQLLAGAGIYDEKPKSFGESLKIYFKNFLTHPFSIIGTYATNYCSIISLCKNYTPDGVFYKSTSQLELVDIYENGIIGYRTFSSYGNIFEITDELSIQAEHYRTPTDTNIFDIFMKILIYPTNIIYKIALALCPIAFIGSIIIFAKLRKHKKQPNSSMIELCIILSGTAFLHTLISAFMGLVIDRYSVEAFVPACLGIFGFIAMLINYIKNTK